MEIELLGKREKGEKFREKQIEIPLGRIFRRFLHSKKYGT